MKSLVTLLVIALVATGGGVNFGRKLLAQKTEQVSASDKAPLIARAERRDIAFSIEVSGDVTPTTPLDVKAEVGGKLKKLHVEPGDTVKPGDVLVEIDDRDLLTE